jgi:hypothetical protein
MCSLLLSLLVVGVVADQIVVTLKKLTSTIDETANGVLRTTAPDVGKLQHSF